MPKFQIVETVKTVVVWEIEAKNRTGAAMELGRRKGANESPEYTEVLSTNTQSPVKVDEFTWHSASDTAGTLVENQAVDVEARAERGLDPKK